MKQLETLEQEKARIRERINPMVTEVPIDDYSVGLSFDVPLGDGGMLLSQFLDTLVENGREITDIKIEYGKPVWFRVDGAIKPYVESGRVSDEDMKNLVEALIAKCLPDEEFDEYLQGKTDFDISFQHAHKTEDNKVLSGRFRFVAVKAYDGWMLGGRIILNELPDASVVTLPKSVYDAVSNESGIILVTGPQGSGKSTSLAMLVQYILDNQPKNVVTFEDPIEFKFRDNIGTITQRELFSDGWARAFASMLRSNTQVLYITELRNPEIMRLAINASEQNMLVLASLHTKSVAHTASRILGAFPVLEQEVIAASFAEQVKLIANQRLVPCYSISGYEEDGRPIFEMENIAGVDVLKVRRKAVYEVVYATEKIKAAIRMNRPGDIMDGIYDEARKDETGKLGVSLLNQQLVGLIKTGELTISNAVSATYDRGNLATELEAAGFDIHDDYF